MKPLITGKIGMMVKYHIPSWNLCYIVRYHLLLPSIVSALRKQNLLVIDIAHLGCPDLKDMRQPATNCTFASHNTSKLVSVLRTAYSVAQWLEYYTLRLQYVKCPPQPAFH